MRGPSPLYIEERHRALGRDATFSWSRALTHPPRCNRTRHRGRHLDFVGAAILVSWGPPSWTGSRGGRHLGSEVWGRHLGSDVVTSLTLNRRLYYFVTQLVAFFRIDAVFLPLRDNAIHHVYVCFFSMFSNH